MSEHKFEINHRKECQWVYMDVCVSLMFKRTDIYICMYIYIYIHTICMYTNFDIAYVVYLYMLYMTQS